MAPFCEPVNPYGPDVDPRDPRDRQCGVDPRVEDRCSVEQLLDMLGQ
jgi:hypothetical protein